MKRLVRHLSVASVAFLSILVRRAAAGQPRSRTSAAQDAGIHFDIRGHVRRRARRHRACHGQPARRRVQDHDDRPDRPAVRPHHDEVRADLLGRTGSRSNSSMEGAVRNETLNIGTTFGVTTATNEVVQGQKRGGVTPSGLAAHDRHPGELLCRVRGAGGPARRAPGRSADSRCTSRPRAKSRSRSTESRRDGLRRPRARRIFRNTT